MSSLTPSASPPSPLRFINSLGEGEAESERRGTAAARAPSAGNGSVVWNYFTRDVTKNKCDQNQKINCNLCGKVYKTCGNTTNLATHLKNKHNFAYMRLVSAEAETDKKNRREMIKINKINTKYSELRFTKR